jgi:Domain of unknown function (DUF4124)
MRFTYRWLIAMGALYVSAGLEAQIYTCTAKDGTRVFSDERCGPDAKVVPNISTSKKSPAKTTASGTATPRPKVEPKNTAELHDLLEKCNAGDMSACNTWTRAGGPNSLREKEQAAEKACEAGSLSDCEYRYCNGAISDECRARVLQAAKVAGENWYLRDTGKPQADGSTRYDVRCIPAGARTMRDVVMACSGKAGPNRCTSAGATTGQARLDLAATAVCGPG